MLIIVGLGNPGLAYRKTFHNIGFRSVDKLAELLSVKFKHNYCAAKVAEYYYNGEKIIIAKPQTYMNNSGESVKQLLAKFGAKSTDLLVVYDDVDLPFGSIRIRSTGSAGTHNGMRSVVQMVGSDVPRIRAGIGKGSVDVPLFSYVLSRVPKDKATEEEYLTNKISEALQNYIEVRDIDKVGQHFNITAE